MCFLFVANRLKSTNSASITFLARVTMFQTIGAHCSAHFLQFTLQNKLIFGVYQLFTSKKKKKTFQKTQIVNKHKTMKQKQKVKQQTVQHRTKYDIIVCNIIQAQAFCFLSMYIIVFIFTFFYFFHRLFNGFSFQYNFKIRRVKTASM